MAIGERPLASAALWGILWTLLLPQPAAAGALGIVPIGPGLSGRDTIERLAAHNQGDAPALRHVPAWPPVDRAA